jgi:hypothetical protein
MLFFVPFLLKKVSYTAAVWSFILIPLFTTTIQAGVNGSILVSISTEISKLFFENTFIPSFIVYSQFCTFYFDTRIQAIIGIYVIDSALVSSMLLFSFSYLNEDHILTYKDYKAQCLQVLARLIFCNVVIFLQNHVKNIVLIEFISKFNLFSIFRN